MMGWGTLSACVGAISVATQVPVLSRYAAPGRLGGHADRPAVRIDGLSSSSTFSNSFFLVMARLSS